MNWTRERVPLKTNFCEYNLFSFRPHPVIKPPHGKTAHSPSPADLHKSHHASLSELSACRVWVFVLIPVSGRTDSNWNSRISVCLCVFQATGESRSPWAAVTIGRDVSSRGNETQCQIACGKLRIYFEPILGWYKINQDRLEMCGSEYRNIYNLLDSLND